MAKDGLFGVKYICGTFYIWRSNWNIYWANNLLELKPLFNVSCNVTIPNAQFLTDAWFILTGDIFIVINTNWVNLTGILSHWHIFFKTIYHNFLVNLFRPLNIVTGKSMRIRFIEVSGIILILLLNHCNCIEKKAFKTKEPLHSCMMHESYTNTAFVVLVVVERRKGRNKPKISLPILTQRIDNHSISKATHKEDAIVIYYSFLKY